MVYKRLDRSLIQLDTVDSTNAYAQDLVKNGDPVSGTVVLAKNQTRGRGQRSNTWTTEAGKNLTCSLIFRHPLAISRVFYLNMATSLAIRKLLDDLGIEAEIKWPNDIMIGEQKICGILIENQIAGNHLKSSIIGIGLNVNQQSFQGLTATSIRKELGEEVELEVIFDQLYGYLDFYISLLAESNFDLLKKHYYNYLYRKGISAEYEDENGKFEGVITGVDELGMLMIKVGSHIRKYGLKQLRYH